MVDWVLAFGLAATLAWTTLCLGGYLAETMVWSSRAVVALAVVALLRTALAPRSQPLRLHWAVLLPVPFLVFALASVLWIAPARWLAWREWLLWLQAWLVFAIVLHGARGRGHVRVLARTFVMLAVVGAAMAAYQRFADPEWMMLGHRQAASYGGRSAGSFGIPNSLAAQLELVTPLCLVLLSSRAVTLAMKVLCGWLAAAFIVTIIFTGSRGGWIGLGGALLAWPLLGGGNWRRRVAGAALVAVALMALGAGLIRFSATARERIEPLLAGRAESSRPILWKAGAQIWQTAPWLGTGAASYNVLFNRYRPRGFVDEPDWTHNDYLNTLGDYGLVGFALWLGAGGAILGLGWRAVQRARRESVPVGNLFVLWRWKFGLWLGLFAFAVHLFVDFHTKIPALAFMSAISAALLLREETGMRWQMRRSVGIRLGAAVAAIGLVALWIARADRLYRAEAARFEPRREINRLARRGEENFLEAIPPAVRAFQRATAIDPQNGQAWADLSYATALSWHRHRGDKILPGLLAEQTARRALELCPQVAEFWVRLGVAQDMTGRRTQARASFDEALKLAPNSSEYWFYLAYHLAAVNGVESEARAAVDTCLALDPGNRQGLALRERLQARTLRN